VAIKVSVVDVGTLWITHVALYPPTDDPAILMESPGWMKVGQFATERVRVATFAISVMVPITIPVKEAARSNPFGDATMAKAVVWSVALGEIPGPL
jgi:hypothetical protein